MNAAEVRKHAEAHYYLEYCEQQDKEQLALKGTRNAEREERRKAARERGEPRALVSYIQVACVLFCLWLLVQFNNLIVAALNQIITFVG